MYMFSREHGNKNYSVVEGVPVEGVIVPYYKNGKLMWVLLKPGGVKVFMVTPGGSKCRTVYATSEDLEYMLKLMGARPGDVEFHSRKAGFPSTSYFKKFMENQGKSPWPQEAFRGDLKMSALPLYPSNYHSTRLVSFRRTSFNFQRMKSMFLFNFLHLCNISYIMGPTYLCYFVRVSDKEFLIFYWDMSSTPVYILDIFGTEIEYFRLNINHTLKSNGYQIVITPEDLFCNNSLFLHTSFNLKP